MNRYGERARSHYKQFLPDSLILRDHAVEGQAHSLPRLVQAWTPREHQRNAVARMIAEPEVGLFHEVGAARPPR